MRKKLSIQEHGPVEERATLKEITTVQALDKLFSVKDDQNHLVYLHDPWCPVSALALREVVQVDTDVATIDVNHHEEIVLEFDKLTGMSHESPHVFVIRNSKPVWNVSHEAITRPAIERALAT